MVRLGRKRGRGPDGTSLNALLYPHADLASIIHHKLCIGFTGAGSAFDSIVLVESWGSRVMALMTSGR